jgi:hypothetical protein
MEINRRSNYDLFDNQHNIYGHYSFFSDRHKKKIESKDDKIKNHQEEFLIYMKNGLDHHV